LSRAIGGVVFWAGRTVTGATQVLFGQDKPFVWPAWCCPQDFGLCLLRVGLCVMGDPREVSGNSAVCPPAISFAGIWWTGDIFGS
jgi:hypothetical protein